MEYMIIAYHYQMEAETKLIKINIIIIIIIIATIKGSAPVLNSLMGYLLIA